MAEIISTDDLPEDIVANAMAEVWVAGANARAARVAPCLVATEEPFPTEDQLAEARLVLIGAVMRWSQTGAGAFQSQTVGPFGVTFDNRQRGGYNLWPAEITQLQDICKNGGSGAWSYDTAPSSGYHSPICSLYFGGDDCSCGVALAGYPIYEP